MDDSVIKPLTRRERRRKLNEENIESPYHEHFVIKTNKVTEKKSNTDTISSRTLVRRDTFTVLKPRTVFNQSLPDHGNEDSEEVKIEEEFGKTIPEVPAPIESEDSQHLTHTIDIDTGNEESRNLTYDIGQGSSRTEHDTYSIQNIESEKDMERPVPAPRRRLTMVAKESDKNSSDTDKDVMEIEVDVLSNATEPEKESDPVKNFATYESDRSPEQVPKPKPRKLSSITIAQASLTKTDMISKSKSMEQISVRLLRPRSTKSNPETKSENYNIDLGEMEAKQTILNQTKKRRKFMGLLQRGKQKKRSKLFAAVKFERNRIPTISSILKDIKEDSSKTKLKEEESKIDFQIESPRLPQSEPNSKMYVQYKNGFHVKNREDFFKQEEELFPEKKRAKRTEDSMSSSMLNTAMLFQKFWSRSMMYFHGLLAGFGFAHAFAITSVLFYFNYEIKGFIDVYSSLALKVHFIFYTLIAQCIISCLDRLDVAHLRKKHWQHISSKYPSLWIILIIYIVSFSLTFVNHRTESRFESYRYQNITGEMLWDMEVDSNVPSIFSTWYGIIWARDVMVLTAWLLITLTEYPDNLYLYLKSLKKKTQPDNVNNGI